MKNFLRFIGEYKKYVILSPVCVIGEVVMEILIPFIMAKIIDNGVIGGAGMSYIAYVGFIMIIMSIVSLIFGVVACLCWFYNDYNEYCITHIWCCGWKIFSDSSSRFCKKY